MMVCLYFELQSNTKYLSPLYTTIISGKVEMGSKSGPRAYLTDYEEEELVRFLTNVSSLGYSRTIKQVIDIVQEVVNQKFDCNS